MRLDWVVNEDTYGRDGLIGVPAGNIAAAPLTYAPFLWQTEMFSAAVVRTRAAFPEGEKQFVKAVVGHIGYNPGAWSAGSSMEFMLRIVKKPQDFSTAGAITDAAYNPMDWAYSNERFAWQSYVFDAFQAGTEHRTWLTVRANVNQWLEPDEALYLVYANTGAATTVSVNFRPFLRTLMRADS